MSEDEIREIVRQTVRATLRELLSDDLPHQTHFLEREFSVELKHQVTRLGLLISGLEKKWSDSTICRYEKKTVDAIKLETSRIR